MVRKDLWASVPLGGGLFEVVQLFTPPSTYGGDDGHVELYAYIRIDEEVVEVDSFQDVVDWSADKGLELPVEVSRAPDIFANFVGFFDLGLLVLGPGACSFVDDLFPVNVAKEVPRVVGESLFFLVGRFGLTESPAVWRVDVNLKTGVVGKDPVPRLSR